MPGTQLLLLLAMATTARTHLQQIIESSIDFAIIVTDLNGTVTDWNQGATNVFGWTSEEIAGQTIERIFTLEDRRIDRAQEEMRLSVADGRAEDERWHMRKDGSRFWASGEMMPLRDETGAHQGYVKILRDRTRQHEAGKQLRKFKDRFETLVETVETAFAVVEVEFDEADRALDYRFIEANPAFERQAGVNLRGKWVTEFAPNLERFWFDTYGRVALTGEPANFESYAEAFGRWFDVRAIRIGEPEERQIAIFFNDVTDRRAAEERLRASEATARENIERVQLALSAGAIIGTWNWDLPTDCFTVDEAFATTFGLDSELGRTGLSLAEVVATVHPDDQTGLAAAINAAIQNGGTYAHQYRVRRVDGKYYWIEANGRVDHAEDGTPLRFPGVLLDVQERRALQEERDRNAAALRALNETLEQRVEQRSKELQASQEQLRQSQKMEAIGQLTGGIAHDFNNMLATITSSLELMNRRIASGKGGDLTRYLTLASTAAQSAAALIKRLLAFSRKQTLDLQALDVNAAIAQMEDMLRRSIGEQIQFELALQPGLPTVKSDRNQLENALLNLTINARDAMPEGGVIRISTSSRELDASYAAMHPGVIPGPYVMVSVSDDGMGMSPEVVAKAFDPFFTTKPIGQGTGLGLSMIYGFARQTHGHASIHSVQGEGTTVNVYLPCNLTTLEAPVTQQQLVARLPKGKGETVLFVEDEPGVRAVLGEILGELGYVTHEAIDAPSALAIEQNLGHLDLLVTDVGLPGTNGRQLAEMMCERRPGLRVLFVTGYANKAAIKGEFLGRGMDMLAKPFTIDALAHKVQIMLSQPTFDSSSSGTVAGDSAFSDLS
ncbi:MAG: PAS domain S-box protein [Pseudomonas sp.]|nr:MAG: PAS domain S-box protein [Pseudomonas sp.]